tara:strand:- start:34 stop:504 length:471 start_codon:yes stop_codon:yes gene_type:complete
MVLFNVLVFVCSSIAYAEHPSLIIDIPPASAALVTDSEIIKQIAVGRDEDPVWCYSEDANAIIISAPEREREKCKLRLTQQRQSLEALYKLQLSSLEVELESLTKKNSEIMTIKNQEILELTNAALKRPNDYSMWWATGGFTAGALTVLSILWATQ